jgi:hypothetical protein
MREIKKKSSCCGVSVYIFKKRDGAIIYKCCYCDKPCDIAEEKPQEWKEQLEKILRAEMSGILIANANERFDMRERLLSSDSALSRLVNRLLTEKDNHWQKIVYGERQMYERGLKDGRQEAIENCIKNLPKQVKDTDQDGFESSCLKEGFNNAIQEAKNNLNKLKEGGDKT